MTRINAITNQNNEASIHKDKKTLLTEAALYILEMFITFLAILFVIRCLFPISRVDGSSNEPTFKESDITVFNSFDKNYEVGKMINFRGAGDFKGMLINKRIMAVAGDLIEIDKATGEIRINGEVIVPANENYTPPMELIDTPMVVPEGYVFVLGDNRAVSLDSRYKKMGLISTDSIKGTLLFRIPVSELLNS